MGVRRSRITGVGSFLPPRVVTNDELASLMETTDEWIRQRTGIETRHWVEGTTTTSDLALRASQQALDMAGVSAPELDLIVMATISPDHEFPGAGCFLQEKLGAPGIASLDIRQACTGFVYGISIADQFIRTGMYQRVLVVGAEVHSKGLDKTTRGRDVAVLFGDGAGAVVLEATDVEDVQRDPHILSTHLHADGRFARELWMEAPTMAHDSARITHDMLDRGLHYPYMNGKLVFVHASKNMPAAVIEACEANGVTVDQVDLFLFHQANLRINQQVAKQLGIDDAKVFNTIQKYANTTAGTIPIGMRDALDEGALQPGMLVACAAFGSGFTWGSILLRY